MAADYVQLVQEAPIGIAKSRIIGGNVVLQKLEAQNLLDWSYFCDSADSIVGIPGNTALRQRFFRKLLCRGLILPACCDMCCSNNFEVSEGKVRVAVNWAGQYTRFLQGVHRYENWCNPWNVWGEVELTSTYEPLVKGPLGIITVPQGVVGLFFDQGIPVVMPPGMHQWNSYTLSFDSVVDISRSVVQLGPITIVNVEANYAAVTQNNGVLEILEEIDGSRVHILPYKTWQFEGFLSMKIQTSKIRVQGPTCDNVMIDVDANVVWHIRKKLMRGPDGEKLPGTHNALRWALDTMRLSQTEIGKDQATMMDTRSDMKVLREYVDRHSVAAVRAQLVNMFFLKAPSQHSPMVTDPGVIEGSQIGVGSGPSKGRSVTGLEWESSAEAAIKETNFICNQIGVEVTAVRIVSAIPSNKSLIDQFTDMQNARTAANIKVVKAEGDAQTQRITAQASADAEAACGKGKADAAEAMAAVQNGLAGDLERISRAGQALNGAGKRPSSVALVGATLLRTCQQSYRRLCSRI